jgi:DNA-binding transcriptional ArsR family regulator
VADLGLLSEIASTSIEVLPRERPQAGAIFEGMNTGPLIAEIAGLVGEPARAAMLSALLDGRAFTATELAYAARVTPQTASTHLAKLTEAGLLMPVRDGRYRYFRLASPKVVEILDGIMAVAVENRPRYDPCRGRDGSLARRGSSQRRSDRFSHHARIHRARR